MFISEEFLYHPDVDLLDLSMYINFNIEIKIEKKFLTRRNKNIIANKIWGTDYYTSRSDPVCVFLHNNWFTLKEIKKKSFEAVGLVLLVSKKKKNYLSSTRNNITSKKLTNISIDVQNIKPISYKFYPNIKFNHYHKLSSKLYMKPIRKPIIKPNQILFNGPTLFGEMIFNMNSELALKYDIINLCDKSPKPTDFLSNLLNQYYLILETKMN